jgi:hypothetical protein
MVPERQRRHWFWHADEQHWRCAKGFGSRLILCLSAIAVYPDHALLLPELTERPSTSGTLAMLRSPQTSFVQRRKDNTAGLPSYTENDRKASLKED